MPILRFNEKKTARNGRNMAISRTIMLFIFNQIATDNFVNTKILILQHY